MAIRPYQVGACFTVFQRREEDLFSELERVLKGDQSISKSKLSYELSKDFSLLTNAVARYFEEADPESQKVLIDAFLSFLKETTYPQEVVSHPSISRGFLSKLFTRYELYLIIHENPDIKNLIVSKVVSFIREGIDQEFALSCAHFYYNSKEQQAKIKSSFLHQYLAYSFHPKGEVVRMILDEFGEEESVTYSSDKSFISIVNLLFFKNFSELGCEILYKKIEQSTKGEFLELLKELKVRSYHLPELLSQYIRFTSSSPRIYYAGFKEQGELILSTRDRLLHYQALIPKIACNEKVAYGLLEFLGSFDPSMFEDVRSQEDQSYETPEAAKEVNLSLFRSFLEESLYLHPKQGIPEGKEKFYYCHIRRVVAHLFQAINKEKMLGTLEQKKEQYFTYCLELAKVGQYCYTMQNTKALYVYSQLGHLSEVEVDLTEQELQTNLFLSSLKKELHQQINSRVFSFFEGENIHLKSAVEHISTEFLGYDQTSDFLLDEFVLTGYVALAEKLGVEHEEINEENLEMITASNFLEHFTEELFTPDQVFEISLAFIQQNLNHEDKEHSSRFLAHLAAYLEKNAIPSHALLNFDEQDQVYTISKLTLLDLMIKAQIVL